MTTNNGAYPMHTSVISPLKGAVQPPPPLRGRRRQRAAVIVFKATALLLANAGKEAISGLVCIG
jgi:hypothetical protein